MKKKKTIMKDMNTPNQRSEYHNCRIPQMNVVNHMQSDQDFSRYYFLSNSFDLDFEFRGKRNLWARQSV